MDKEIKYLLEEIKDNTHDYVGTNGCLYQDLSREELNLLLEYINNLEQQCKKQKEVINKAIDLIKKSVITDVGVDSNNNIIHYHQLTEDETGELLDILKEVE